jgi:hypothetical protein
VPLVCAVKACHPEKKLHCWSCASNEMKSFSVKLVLGEMTTWHVSRFCQCHWIEGIDMGVIEKKFCFVIVTCSVVFFVINFWGGWTRWHVWRFCCHIDLRWFETCHQWLVRRLCMSRDFARSQNLNALPCSQVHVIMKGHPLTNFGQFVHALNMW